MQQQWQNSHLRLQKGFLRCFSLEGAYLYPVRDRHFLGRMIASMSSGTANTAPKAQGFPVSSKDSCSCPSCAAELGQDELMRPAADAWDESSAHTQDEMLRDLSSSADSRISASVTWSFFASV